MKKLLQFLIKFKWTLMFPFASLLIWFYGFMTSSGERFLPWIFNRVLDYYIQNNASVGNSSIVTLCNNIKWFVNGLNAWVPIFLLFSYCFYVLAWRFAYFAVRAFIRLLTLGQV